MSVSICNAQRTTDKFYSQNETPVLGFLVKKMIEKDIKKSPLENMRRFAAMAPDPFWCRHFVHTALGRECNLVFWRHVDRTKHTPECGKIGVKHRPHADQQL